MADAPPDGRLRRVPADPRRIHLIGAGGTAMAALAGMLAARGYEVAGSDNQLYEPSASMLARARIAVTTDFSSRNLEPPPDLVVVGNVITRDNPEAGALLQSGIPYLSMPEALWRFFLRERRVLMVAGTHGKTTSTAMMAEVLNHAGRDPSMLIGGVAMNFASNYRLGDGTDFVIEGDEYDTAFFDKGPKFLHYHPAGAIVTSVEFDHADIYRDFGHVKSSFRALGASMHEDDVIAVCADSPAALEVVEGSRAKKVTFGLERGNLRATDIAAGSGGMRFTVRQAGEVVAPEIRLKTIGRMNVRNALGVFALLLNFGLGAEEIARGLESFRGVARRQQVIGEAGGVTVIDDFAHHPTAVRVTLEAIAESHPGRRILCTFEPRSNTSRRKVFQREFERAFDAATCVWLAPVYFKPNDPIPPSERLDTEALAGAIRSRGPKATACGSSDEILGRMIEEAREGDMAVFMSNGPFADLKTRFLAALQTRPRAD